MLRSALIKHIQHGDRTPSLEIKLLSRWHFHGVAITVGHLPEGQPVIYISLRILGIRLTLGVRATASSTTGGANEGVMDTVNR